MQDVYDVFVLTSDKDLNETIPHADIRSDVWHEKEGITVYYLSDNKKIVDILKSALAKYQFDIIYLNSLYSYSFTILPLIAFYRKKINAKIILAPRGMLNPNALKFKYYKKAVFLKVLNLSKILDKLYLHATSQDEYDHILKNLNISSKQVYILENFPNTARQKLKVIEKKKNELSIIYCSRIHPIKNLHLMLSFLRKVPENISLKVSIFGSIEDDPYWNECEAIMDELRIKHKVEYFGAIPHKEVDGNLMDNHLFILLTSGENFGHIIFESILVGTPVLISDQTPWKNLEQKRAGWDIDRFDEDSFINIITYIAAMNQDEYNLFAQDTWDYGKTYISGLNLKEKYLKDFG